MRSSARSRTLRRRIDRLRRSDSGVAAIEFSLLALPFFLIIFATVETSIIFIAEIAMDNAVEEVSRSAKLGILDDASENAFRQDFCRKVGPLFDCAKIQIDMRSYASFSDVPRTIPLRDGHLNSSDFQYQVPEAEDIVFVQIYYEWPLVTDFMRRIMSDMTAGSHLITGHAVFRSEPFE